ncbi:MAG: HlyD family efflux transporter periplasmic adaptor subunit [Rhodobacterales bacterium]|nr:HlyD family efflux transporter periplasmic adaptor subunit [Rhodobacterales bacterium]
MPRLIPALSALAVLALAVWALLPRPVPVELADIAPRTLEVTIEEEGVARIREVFTVSSPIAGRLSRIGLHPGDAVVAGQTVVASIGPAAPALLDSRARAVAEASVAAAQAAVDLATAQLAQAQAAAEFATAEAARAQALFDRAATSQRLLDAAILDLRTAQAAVDSARANLAVRSRELESARAVLAGTGLSGTQTCCVDVTAPVSGQVLRVLTESEQVVPAGTPILEIGNPGNLEVAVDLLSRDAVRVQPGAAAQVTGWGGPPLAATVARIDPAAVTRVSALGIDEQRVTVILTLGGDPQDWQALGHGFRVIARIGLWRAEDVLSIPVGALFRDGSDWATYVLRDGRAALQRITLGERNDDIAQVLTGLQAGDRVILHPSDRIAPGVRVAPDP